jgi:hypothetical protein
MARTDIPNGTLQVLDLYPNSSQYIPAYTPGTGQTKYVTNPVIGSVQLRTDGTLVPEYVDGLSAYLMDVVEPGGIEVASGTVIPAVTAHGDHIHLAGVQINCVENYATGTAQCTAAVAAADTFSVKTIAFQAVNGVPDPALQQFRDVAGSGSKEATATSLAAAINNAASQALITAIAPAGVVVSAANGGTDTVTLTASARGLQGELALAQTGAHITLSGATMIAAVPAAASQEFAGALQAVGGTDAAIAASLRLAINDAATIVLMKAATGGPYVSSSAPVGAVLTLSAKTVAGAAQVGPDGNLEFTVSSSTRLVQDALAVVSGTLNRLHQQWTPATQNLVTASLLARVAGGSALDLAGINTSLALGGAELTTASGSHSTGTIAGVLEVLSAVVIGFLDLIQVQ